MSQSSQYRAARQARALLIRTLPGSRHGSVKSHVRRAEHIAEEVWKRFQVGPHQWQLKHARWFLSVWTRELAATTRYDYWRTLRALLHALEHLSNWETRLNGPWLRPTGERGELKPGRPTKLPGKFS